MSKTAMRVTARADRWPVEYRARKFAEAHRAYMDAVPCSELLDGEVGRRVVGSHGKSPASSMAATKHRARMECLMNLRLP